jgi:hypothetical protein
MLHYGLDSNFKFHRDKKGRTRVMNTSKLITGVAALVVLFTTGAAHAARGEKGSTNGAPPAKLTVRTSRKVVDKLAVARGQAFVSSKEVDRASLDLRTAGGEVRVSMYRSRMIEENPALHILRELDVVVLQKLVLIPSHSIVQCGNVCPAEHRIAGHIPDQNRRESLRNWVRGNGHQWTMAVQEALAEKLGE